MPKSTGRAGGFHSKRSRWQGVECPGRDWRFLKDSAAELFRAAVESVAGPNFVSVPSHRFMSIAMKALHMNAPRILLLLAALVMLAPGAALAQVAPMPQQPITGGAVAPPAEPDSAWGWLKMPKITMPKIEMPKMPADPLAPIKTSARKVGDGTKKAWEGTKELFTFGQKKSAATQPTEQLSSNPEQPSVWKRMFGGGEPEPQGPQTVADWMAQERPQ
jgi:hypothetical protein